MTTPYTNQFFKFLNDLVKKLKGQHITINGAPIGFNGRRLILGTLSHNKLILMYGTAIGFYLEQAIFDYLIDNQNNGYKFQIKHHPHTSPNDYSIRFNMNNQNYLIKVESKVALKNDNCKLTNDQIEELYNKSNELIGKNIATNQQINDSSYIIYCIYDLKPKSNGTIEVYIKESYFMPIEFAVSDTYRITNTKYKKETEKYQSQTGKKSIYENLSLSQALSLIDLYCKQNINESKNHIMLKKFIEENFSKKGDYLYPKDGDPKSTFHEENDKGLLKFFAEHGITKFMSIYSSHVPCLGFSPDEQKWYGWSHRAIYGFGIGDSMKKNTCGFEIYKKTSKAKTLDDAKEMATAFAKSVG